jgi:hypothetical protein
VSALSDLAGLLYDILGAAGELERQRQAEEGSTALDRLVERMLARHADLPIKRSGMDSLRFRSADLIYHLTIAGRSTEGVIADLRSDLNDKVESIVIEQKFDPETIELRGRTGPSVIRARVLPSPGWVFLISSSSVNDADDLAKMLDDELAGLDDSSARG